MSEMLQNRRFCKSSGNGSCGNGSFVYGFVHCNYPYERIWKKKLELSRTQEVLINSIRVLDSKSSVSYSTGD